MKNYFLCHLFFYLFVSFIPWRERKHAFNISPHILHKRFNSLQDLRVHNMYGTKYHPEVRFKISSQNSFFYSPFSSRKNHETVVVARSIINGLIRECQVVKNAIKLSRQLGHTLYNYAQNTKTKMGVLQDRCREEICHLWMW